MDATGAEAVAGGVEAAMDSLKSGEATAADAPTKGGAAPPAGGTPQATPLPPGAGLLDQVFARHLENRIEIIKEVQAEMSGGRDGGSDLIEVPSIIAVGAQNARKSSVLSALTGIALPANGVEPRCPVIIRLVNDGHCGKPKAFVSDKSSLDEGRYTVKIEDLSTTADEVQRMIDILAGHGEAGYYAESPVYLTVIRPYGPSVTVIDLPGIVPPPDNPDDGTKVRLPSHMKDPIPSMHARSPGPAGDSLAAGGGYPGSAAGSEASFSHGGGGAPGSAAAGSSHLAPVDPAVANYELTLKLTREALASALKPASHGVSEHPQAVVLAVLNANTNFGLDEALNEARLFDREGISTIGVVTGMAEIEDAGDVIPKVYERRRARRHAVCAGVHGLHPRQRGEEQRAREASRAGAHTTLHRRACAGRAGKMLRRKTRIRVRAVRG